MTTHRVEIDDHANEPDLHETEQLMMPGTYLPPKHRDRKMPQRKPRTHAVWTSQSKDY